MTVEEAVKRIIAKLGLDPTDETTYGGVYTTSETPDSSNDFSGIAQDTLRESLNELITIMTNNNSLNDIDVVGLVSESEQTVSAGGTIDLSGISDIFRVRSVYADPDGTSPLTKDIKLKTANEIANFMGDSSLIDDNKVIVYQIGKTLKFLPKTSASGKNVMVVYLKYDNTTWSYNTELQNTYSRNFINMAIDLASKKLLADRKED